MCVCVWQLVTQKASTDFVLRPRRGPFLYALLAWLVSVSLPPLHPLSHWLSVCHCPPCDLQFTTTATAAAPSRKHFTLCEWTSPLSLFYHAPSPYQPHLCMHQFLVISCYFVLCFICITCLIFSTFFFFLSKICFYFSPSPLLVGLVRRHVPPVAEKVRHCQLSVHVHVRKCSWTFECFPQFLLAITQLCVCACVAAQLAPAATLVFSFRLTFG